MTNTLGAFFYDAVPATCLLMRIIISAARAVIFFTEESHAQRAIHTARGDEFLCNYFHQTRPKITT